MQIVVGTRGSKLALYNTQRFINKVREIFEDIVIEIKIVKTEGDVDKRNIIDFQSVGIFTKALEEELIKGNIDIAIHSFKDLPLNCNPELKIAGVLKRENVFDIIISKNNKGLWELDDKSIIGTSSQRRIFQLEYCAKGKAFVYKHIRGNIDTRCEKVKNGEYDAIIISGASIPILNSVSFRKLDYDIMLTAPAQSAICCQVRKKDKRLLELTKSICDEESFEECKMERQVLKILGGGCFNRVAARCFFKNKLLKVRFQKENSEVKNLSLTVNRIEDIDRNFHDFNGK